MVSCSLTLIFYGTSFLLVTKRCLTVSARLLAVGALPAIWISICAVAGLLDTCLGLSPVIVLASVVVGLVVYTARTPRATGAPQRLHLGWCAWMALGISGAFALAVAAHAHWVEPWGGWDTLFTWVMRARFFSIGGSQWQNAFSNDLALLHPDYPPMLSWALHALWRVDGQNSSFAVITLFDPVCLAFVFFILGFQSISTERLQLDVPAAALLAMPILWKLAAAILADFALSYAILGSCAFYAFSISKQDPRAAFAASFLAAWSGLIKNEGMVWCIAFLAVTISAGAMARDSVRRRIVCTLVAGAAIPLAALITFKLTLAPPSDLVDPTRTSEISDIVQPGILINPERLIIRLDQVEFFLYHRVILHHVWQVLFDWRDWGVALWLCLYLFVKRFRRPGPSAHLLTAIGIQLAMYYGVYLITPYLVWWHISNSLSRILVHIVPGALCLLAFDKSSRTAAIQRSNQISELQKPLPRRLAAIYLIAVSACNLTVSLRGHWNLGKLPPVNIEELQQIELPHEPTASYVSTDLGTRDLYTTQFAAVPTVLVVDRRESLLLARFPDESQLRRYCEQNQWELQMNRGGLGWARDKGGKELRQAIVVPDAWKRR